MGNGPLDSKLVGLNILPIDTLTLADGTVLTFVKANQLGIKWTVSHA